MSTPVKVFKKGEFLYREGDKISHLQVIQSGGVSLCLSRGKKNLDLFQISTNQVTGEAFLNGATTHSFSAVATAETKVVEIPVDIFKASVDQAPQMVKVLVKSLIDRMKMAGNEVKSARLEKDSSPCPDDQVAKIFGSLFHTVNHKGKKDEKIPGKYTIEWPLMKQYAQRIFGESPLRLEQALVLLRKLKMAEFEMGRPPEDPEGPEQIMVVHISNLEMVEAFFEYYQYFYFKNGKTEVLKPEESTMSWVHLILEMSKSLPLDRHGVASLDFAKAVESFKTELGVNLKNDHFLRLEQKGVLIKRQSRSDGGLFLQFAYKELEHTYQTWKIIREIEKWNEKGFVDLTEVEVKAKKPTDGPCCPQCDAGLPQAAKFCSECGFKIAA